MSNDSALCTYLYRRPSRLIIGRHLGFLVFTGRAKVVLSPMSSSTLKTMDNKQKLWFNFKF